MRPVLPSLEDIRALPKVVTQSIPEQYLDHNGHMNMRYYIALYDDAGWPYFSRLGIDLERIQVEKRGIFDLEHHIHYLREVHAGDTISIYSRFIARSAKRIHGIWFMVNDTRDELANLFEFVTIHTDLAARRSTPFPEDIAAKVAAEIEAVSQPTWPPPVCGVMHP